MHVDAVVFDLDGTLIDSRKDIANSANITLSRFNLPTMPDEIIAGFIGGGVEPLVKRCLGKENMDKFEEILALFKKVYSENCTIYTVLYPGVKEVLEFLRQKGIIVALATNKITEISKKILRSLEIEGYFYTVMGPESVKKRKPDPEIIRILLDKINVPAERTMMIGDSEMDVFCGKNAGTFTCAVTYGLGTLESIVKSGPDFLICDLRKIKLLIS